MTHKIISKIADIHPYEIVKVELVATTQEEKVIILGMSDMIENYLTMNLEALEILEQNSPFYVIKKVKQNIGFGN